jgi:hypothetical protein
LRTCAEENINGSKRDEVTGGWRKLHDEELHNLYSSLSIIRMIKLRRMRWTDHVARMEEKRNTYRMFMVKPEGKLSLRPRGMCVDNIKIDYRKISWGSMDWIDLIQDRNQWRALLNTVINL